MSYTIKDMLLTPNKWSRSQDQLNKVKAVIVHWVANPGTTAEQNRDFFESRKFGLKDYGAAHLIIGQKGEVVRCLPDNEMAYQVGSKTYLPDALAKLSDYPNDCTIGIECCHIDWDGCMTLETYKTLVELSADELKKHGLNETNLWTHQQVVGWKNCHKWFVDNPDEWIKFKKDVSHMLNGDTAKLSWQQKQGLDSVAYLHSVNQIQNPETWTADKMNEPAPTWLVMTLIARSLGMKK
jgi:N-acetylmuramoyl-L-alanine amidase